MIYHCQKFNLLMPISLWEMELSKYESQYIMKRDVPLPTIRKTMAQGKKNTNLSCYTQNSLSRIR
jgi:hypothetical protein